MSVVEENLEKLPIFLEVVRAGSIRSAAKKLGMSQPAVSRVVRLLEDALLTRLVLREQSGVRVTHSGQKLFELSDHIRVGIESFWADIQSETKIRQKLRIGTYESIAVYFFPDFLKYVADAQAKLELALHTAPSPALMEALRHSRVDLIVSVNPGKFPDVQSATLFQDEYGVFVNPTLTVTRKTPLIAFLDATDKLGREVGSYADASPHSNRSRFVCESFESVKALTLSGLGLGILPTLVAQDSVKAGGLIEFTPRSIAAWRFGKHSIALSYLKHREGDPGITWIQRALQRFERIGETKGMLMPARS